MTTPLPTSAQDYIRILGLAGLCISSGGLHVRAQSKRPGRDPARNDARRMVRLGRGETDRDRGREGIERRGRGRKIWDRTDHARMLIRAKGRALRSMFGAPQSPDGVVRRLPT